MNRVTCPRNILTKYLNESRMEPYMYTYEGSTIATFALMWFTKWIDTICHALKPTSRIWWSFHTLIPKLQNENDTNIRIITENLVITKFLFKVVWQNSKILKYQLKKKKLVHQLKCYCLNNSKLKIIQMRIKF